MIARNRFFDGATKRSQRTTTFQNRLRHFRRGGLNSMTDSFSIIVVVRPEITDAAELIFNTKAGLLINTGAGMGVDSGLPDFRGAQGFWRAYPPLEKLGLRFEEMANPRWFEEDPSLAWGFYGHRLNLYRKTRPHAGYALIQKWAKRMKQGAFVFTSNVDGQFQRAGFDKNKIKECHGSIHHLQCVDACTDRVWSADNTEIEIDVEQMRATGPCPRCPNCDKIARPNILLFGDWQWNPDRSHEQQIRQDEWLAGLEDAPIIIECGAGTQVPSVRSFSERVARHYGGQLIRINPRESHGPHGHIGIALGALEALTAINAALSTFENSKR